MAISFQNFEIQCLRWLNSDLCFIMNLRDMHMSRQDKVLGSVLSQIKIDFSSQNQATC